MPTKTITDAMNMSLVRPPVSSYYTMQVKDVTYHVFNAARIVNIKVISRASEEWQLI